MKKPRADAKLKTLPEGVQAELWELLTTAPEGGTPLTYADARAWLLRTHSLETSPAALSEWYSWYGLALRSSRAKSRAAQAAAMAAQDDPSLSAEELERLGQMVFTAETIEAGSIKDYVSLMRLRLQARQIEQDERRIALLEAKARRLDELEAKAQELSRGGGLSPETLAVIEQQLKLL